MNARHLSEITWDNLERIFDYMSPRRYSILYIKKHSVEEWKAFFESNVFWDSSIDIYESYLLHLVNRKIDVDYIEAFYHFQLLSVDDMNGNPEEYGHQYVLDFLNEQVQTPVVERLRFIFTRQSAKGV